MSADNVDTAAAAGCAHTAGWRAAGRTGAACGRWLRDGVLKWCAAAAVQCKDLHGWLLLLLLLLLLWLRLHLRGSSLLLEAVVMVTG
jgi:hypothetical protein